MFRRQFDYEHIGKWIRFVYLHVLKTSQVCQNKWIQSDEGIVFQVPKIGKIRNVSNQTLFFNKNISIKLQKFFSHTYSDVILRLPANDFTWNFMIPLSFRFLQRRTWISCISLRHKEVEWEKKMNPIVQYIQLHHWTLTVQSNSGGSGTYSVQFPSVCCPIRICNKEHSESGRWAKGSGRVVVIIVTIQGKFN